MDKNYFDVPYLVRLEGAHIQPGHTFKAQGVQTGDKFEVCFVAGNNVEQNDLPLIIDVVQSEKHMYFNDRKAGQLGKRIEKKDPFKKGEAIDLRLRLLEDRMQVFTNMKFFTEYEYRQPLTTITHVSITGGIDLSNVSWGGKHYPVPYETTVEEGFQVDRKLCVSGMPEKKGDSFDINLLNTKGDTAFHLAVRMKEKNIVLNAKLDGKWGSEERIKEFPFKSEMLFDIMIVHEDQAFQVYVDNKHMGALNHRGDSKHINRLLIQNDVELHGVQIK